MLICDTCEQHNNLRQEVCPHTRSSKTCDEHCAGAREQLEGAVSDSGDDSMLQAKDEEGGLWVVRVQEAHINEEGQSRSMMATRKLDETRK